jgi:hypothetical protein
MVVPSLIVKGSNGRLTTINDEDLLTTVLILINAYT